MLIKSGYQYTVFLEHKVGALAKVVCRLKNENVNILAASGSASADGGILRIVVERENSHLKNIFKNIGLYPVKTPIIVIMLSKNSNQDLEYVLSYLAKNNINLQSIFWSDCSQNKELCVALIPDRFEEACMLLEEL